MGVDTTHTGYQAMLSRWEQMRDVCSDEETIHDAGTTYLPMLTGMEEEEYEAYKSRAAFVMFVERIIDGFQGMVLRKPVNVEDNGNFVVGAWTKNVDGTGSDIDAYLKKVMRGFLQYSRCGTLVDMPTVDNVLSIADAEAANIQPKLVFYDVFSIINWRVSNVSNTEVLSMVVLREEVDVPGLDEFSTEKAYQYRVLDLDGAGFYRQRLFNAGSELQDESYPMMNGELMKFIPFVIHGGIDVSYPGLLGIADQNLHLYRADADYAHGLHYVSLPTPCQSGVDPEDPNCPSYIGPSKFITYENEMAKSWMLEFTGAGLGQVKQRLDSIIENIIMLSSRILAPQQISNETALGASIRSSNETSVLADNVNTINGEFNDLLLIVSDWLGSPAFTAVINKDFIPIMVNGSDAMSYLTTWIKGGISYQSLFDVYKRGELIAGDRSIEDEKKDIQAEEAVRRAVEVEMAEKLGTATAAPDEDLKSMDNQFK